MTDAGSHPEDVPVPPPADTAEGGDRSSLRGVMSHMLEEGYFYDFFQVVRLLEQRFVGAPAPGTSSEFDAEPIRFRPHAGLVFPATDVRNIERLPGERERVRLTLTFHGLYGVDSPLPVYFYDALAREPGRTKAMRDFLDMFNHRLYALFYRGWKRHRAYTFFRSDGSDGYSIRHRCLAGLGTPGLAQAGPVRSLRMSAFAGVLGSRIRSAAGLRSILRGLLPGTPVEIIQNIPRWVPIRERPRMGRGKGSKPLRLGQSGNIGATVCDLSGKMRIVIGPMDLDLYQNLLPGGPSARVVQQLAESATTDIVEFDLQLRLETEKIPKLRLGSSSPRLGLTTWVGQPEGVSTSRTVAYARPAA